VLPASQLVLSSFRILVGVLVIGGGMLFAVTSGGDAERARRASEEAASRQADQVRLGRERVFEAAVADRKARAGDTKTYIRRRDGAIDWSKDTIASFRARGGINSNSPDGMIQAIIERNHKEQFAKDGLRARMRWR
jgi:hypothetical protein